MIRCCANGTARKRLDLDQWQNALLMHRGNSAIQAAMRQHMIANLHVSETYAPFDLLKDCFSHINRLRVSGRHVQEELSDLSRADSAEMFGDRLDVPIAHERSRINLWPCLLEEEHEIVFRIHAVEVFEDLPRVPQQLV